jgi:hypothetical protein
MNDLIGIRLRTAYVLVLSPLGRSSASASNFTSFSPLSRSWAHSCMALCRPSHSRRCRERCLLCRPQAHFPRCMSLWGGRQPKEAPRLCSACCAGPDRAFLHQGQDKPPLRAQFTYIVVWHTIVLRRMALSDTGLKSSDTKEDILAGGMIVCRGPSRPSPAASATREQPPARSLPLVRRFRSCPL